MQLVFPDPVLAARGLTLRGLELADVAWITAACGDRELSRHVPAIPYPYSESDARAFIERAARSWAEGTSASFSIAETAAGAGLGVIGLQLSPADPGLAEVGYWLCPLYQHHDRSPRKQHGRLWHYVAKAGFKDRLGAGAAPIRTRPTTAAALRSTGSSKRRSPLTETRFAMC